MRVRLVIVSLILASAGATSAASRLQSAQAPENGTAVEVIAAERAALDRWIIADPQGYLDLYLDDVSYFDPATERRLDGAAAMARHLAPFKGAKLPFSDARYVMIDPRVERHGDLALLTFNLVNYGRRTGQPAESVLARWNATEVYRRTARGWKIMHSHWSYSRPEGPRGAI